MKIRMETGQIVSAYKTAYGWSADIGTYALASAWNALAIESAICAGVEACITFPPHADYPAYETERRLRGTCRELGLEPEEIKLTQNPAVTLPSVMVSAVGYLPEGAGCHEAVEISAENRGQQPEMEEPSAKYRGQQPEIEEPSAESRRTAEGNRQTTGRNRAPSAGTQKIGTRQAAPQNAASVGDEIVLVKWLGMEGMLRIADEKAADLSQRFAPMFLRQIRSYHRELFAGKELEIARSVGVSAVRQITDGGILAALWALAKEAGTGLDLDLKRMSVLQETIEVCEQYRLNPYQLTSAGSFLMVTKDGGALADALRENQTEASVIGRLTEGNGKVIHNGEDIRHLDRPGPDEIFKIWR